jgi:hypothetical protein
MSMTLETPACFSLEDATQFLYREARYLDDRDWDAWLSLYADDAEFWMPSWDDDDKLTEDPQTEISLIWYGHKGGLEDRVFRIRTERSSATSLPEPRTSHNISNVESRSAAQRRITRAPGPHGKSGQSTAVRGRYAPMSRPASSDGEYRLVKTPSPLTDLWRRLRPPMARLWG